MKAAQVIAGLLVIFITMPIWFYLLHYILTTINASELAMFLFWVYVPIQIFGAIIVHLTKQA